MLGKATRPIFQLADSQTPLWAMTTTLCSSRQAFKILRFYIDKQVNHGSPSIISRTCSLQEKKALIIWKPIWTSLSLHKTENISEPSINEYMPRKFLLSPFQGMLQQRMIFIQQAAKNRTKTNWFTYINISYWKWCILAIFERTNTWVRFSNWLSMISYK